MYLYKLIQNFELTIWGFRKLNVHISVRLSIGVLNSAAEHVHVAEVLLPLDGLLVQPVGEGHYFRQSPGGGEQRQQLICETTQPEQDEEIFQLQTEGHDGPFAAFFEEQSFEQVGC